MEKITKIDSNVEMPPVNTARRYPFKDMKVGDSFSAGEYSNVLAVSVRSCVNNYISRYGTTEKFTIRKHEEQVRCWRIN